MKEVQENSHKMINNCKNTLANQSIKHEKEKQYLASQLEAQFLQTMNQINQSTALRVETKDYAEVEMNR